MMAQLVSQLVNAGTLKTERIIDAFLKVDRIGFVREDQKLHAYDDRPLMIGAGQTISQPTTVAFMLELLDLQPGQDFRCGLWFRLADSPAGRDSG